MWCFSGLLLAGGQCSGRFETSMFAQENIMSVSQINIFFILYFSYFKGFLEIVFIFIGAKSFAKAGPAETSVFFFPHIQCDCEVLISLRKHIIQSWRLLNANYCVLVTPHTPTSHLHQQSRSYNCYFSWRKIWNAFGITFTCLLSLCCLQVTELKSLANHVVVGSVSCEMLDLFCPLPQTLAVDINDLGTVKLNLEVTWRYEEHYVYVYESR